MCRVLMRNAGIHEISATYTILLKKKISMVLRNTDSANSARKPGCPAARVRRYAGRVAIHNTTATTIPTMPNT